jgi:hypothetical protein
MKNAKVHETAAFGRLSVVSGVPVRSSLIISTKFCIKVRTVTVILAFFSILGGILGDDSLSKVLFEGYSRGTKGLGASDRSGLRRARSINVSKAFGGIRRRGSKRMVIMSNPDKGNRRGCVE